MVSIWLQFGQLAREGARLIFGAFSFFYRHPVLVVLSLIPSTFRVVQRVQDFDAAFWMEAVVEGTRVLLFVLIIARLERVGVLRLTQKEFWAGYNLRFTSCMSRNWPRVTIAQIVAFIVIMYALMNMLLQWIVNEHTVAAVEDLIGARWGDRTVIVESVMFFLKNMSIIPLSIVCVARMCGFGWDANSDGKS